MIAPRSAQGARGKGEKLIKGRAWRLLLSAGLVALICVALASLGGAAHRDSLKHPRIASKLLGDADSARFGPTSQNERSKDQTDNGPFPSAPPDANAPSST